jgi:uncharacterized membrane protein
MDIREKALWAYRFYSFMSLFYAALIPLFAGMISFFAFAIFGWWGFVVAISVFYIFPFVGLTGAMLLGAWRRESIVSRNLLTVSQTDTKAVESFRKDISKKRVAHMSHRGFFQSRPLRYFRRDPISIHPRTEKRIARLRALAHEPG